jgi:uncharacterized protein YkwD
MPRLANSIFALLPALLLAGVCAAQPLQRSALVQKPRPAIEISDLAKRIHALINRERAKQKLSPLAWDAALARIAATHSRDMVERKYLAHESPEGHGFPVRYRRAGYQCGIRIGRVIHGGAENIALTGLYASVTIVNGSSNYDWNSADAIARKAVDGWMHSPGHRRNILTPYWVHEGIGIAIGPDDRVYVTQNFC